MKRTIIIMLSLLLLIPAQLVFRGETAKAGNAGVKQENDNTLTRRQMSDGWQLLFDGKTLDGWNIKSGIATYKVDNGSIVGSTADNSPNTFLCSGGEFADFELTFEVKYDGEFFNSGVQIRSKLRGTEYGGRVFGPQVEIENSPGQSGYVYGEVAGGWQSPEPDSEDDAVNTHSIFQNDGWNQYRILAVGRKIQTWINGTLVADLTYDEGRYMDNTTGFIGLQVHGVGQNSTPMSIRWKNIYIRPIPGSGEGEAGQVSVPLFNGQNFDGWRFHLGEEGAGNEGTMTVQDGIIVCAALPSGYMYTEKSYSNYIVSYDWAFDRPDDLQYDSLFRGNSGCLVHIGEPNALGVWPLSIEVQGQHRRAGLILPIPRSVKCERTYDREAYRSAINPVGEWSTMTIDVKGGEMVIRVNGIEVSTVKDCELTSGQIGLQSEGAPIRWKNVRILER